MFVAPFTNIRVARKTPSHQLYIWFGFHTVEPLYICIHLQIETCNKYKFQTHHIQFGLYIKFREQSTYISTQYRLHHGPCTQNNSSSVLLGESFSKSYWRSNQIYMHFILLVDIENKFECMTICYSLNNLQCKIVNYCNDVH